VESTKDIFTKISKPEDRSKLLRDLAKARGEILCKGATDAILKLKAYKLEKDRLFCLIQSDSDRPTMTQENVIATFNLGGEKYFFQAVAEYEGGEIVFTALVDLFHLQRRQNYRVRVPESYRGRFEIFELNGKAVKIGGTLQDVSSGGCRVSYPRPQPSMKMEDNLKARILVGSRPAIEIEAVIRHIKTEIQNQPTQTFGMEFLPLTAQLEHRMFGLTMDLHRELFAHSI
jgi:hypothetical protein